jgi:hypothetical protein
MYPHNWRMGTGPYCGPLEDETMHIPPMSFRAASRQTAPKDTDRAATGDVACRLLSHLIPPHCFQVQLREGPLRTYIDLSVCHLPKKPPHPQDCPSTTRCDKHTLAVPEHEADLATGVKQQPDYTTSSFSPAAIPLPLRSEGSIEIQRYFQPCLQSASSRSHP